VLEKTLNDFGIKSWEQVAELQKEDVDKIDQAIAFPGRIEREEWVAQAQELVKRFPDRSERP
jgi:large subunit ribosomal protein L21